MRGIITKRAHDGRRWCLVKGEDGIEYFFSYKALVNPKQFKHYSWIGNRAVFDKDESEEWRLPHAKNVVLAEMKDPNRREKYLHKLADIEAHLAKEEKKCIARDNQEVLKERADRRREYEAQNTWYFVEYFSDIGWKLAYSAGLPIKCKTVESAKQKIAELKSISPDTRFRFVKQFGVAMTVHSNGRKE